MGPADLAPRMSDSGSSPTPREAPGHLTGPGTTPRSGARSWFRPPVQALRWVRIEPSPGRCPPPCCCIPVVAPPHEATLEGCREEPDRMMTPRARSSGRIHLMNSLSCSGSKSLSRIPQIGQLREHPEAEFPSSPGPVQSPFHDEWSQRETSRPGDCFLRNTRSWRPTPWSCRTGRAGSPRPDPRCPECVGRMQACVPSRTSIGASEQLHLHGSAVRCDLVGWSHLIGGEDTPATLSLRLAT